MKTPEGAVRAVKSVVSAADAVPAHARRIEEDQFSALWGGTHNRFVGLAGHRMPWAVGGARFWAGMATLHCLLAQESDLHTPVCILKIKRVQHHILSDHERLLFVLSCFFLFTLM